MNKYLKTSIYFMILALLIQLVPVHVLADSNENPPEDELTEVLLFSTLPDDFIELFEDENGEIVATSIPDGTSVELIDAADEYSQVRYIVESDDVDSEIFEETRVGFVHSSHVVDISDKESFLQKRQSDLLELENQLSESELNDESIESDRSDETAVSDPDESVDSEPVMEDQQAVGTTDSSKEDDEEVGSEVFTPFAAATTAPIIQGVALKKPTNVYSKTSESSSVLKSYQQGHILRFQTYNSSWYLATVYLSGKPHTGYIKASDVDLIRDQQRLTGFSLVQPLSVHTSPTRDSSVLKSYNSGHALIYRSFSSQWHQATVYVNGKAHTGYIHTNDVGPEVRLKGIAVANKVSVYSTTSKSSSKLKTYNQGHVLIYRTFNNSWYKATVILNGKAQTGYINKSDVENIVQTQTSLKGIGVKSPTRVYSSASTSSKTLKSYSQGRVLQYRTFSSNWYEATVIINSKARTGYIHKSDVENVSNQQTRIVGYGSKNPTNVYTNASKSSKILKSYRKSHRLIYRTYTANWYEATVYVNGKARTGYIHKDDVTLTPGEVVVLDPGHGGIDPGAMASGIVEKTLNLDIALRTKKLLENAGITVIMTRSTDVYVELADRAKIANDSNADIFISIHGNSFNSIANGTETFWYGKYERANSILLANTLQNNVVKTTGIRHRRVAEGNFHVIRETKIPSALVEVGFIDNPSDAAKLKQSKYKQLAAQGILNGVLEYFN